jgi:hypothetical protein
VTGRGRDGWLVEDVACYWVSGCEQVTGWVADWVGRGRGRGRGIKYSKAGDGVEEGETEG